MSRDIRLTIQPGESEDDFINRIVDTAPEPSADLIERVRSLLAIDRPAVSPPCTTPRRTTRTAA